MAYPPSRHASLRPFSPCFYFGDYLEKNFPETAQSPLIQQIKTASSSEEIKSLEANVAAMIRYICRRSMGPKVHVSQLYALKNFCGQVGYSTPPELEIAIGDSEQHGTMILLKRRI